MKSMRGIWYMAFRTLNSNFHCTNEFDIRNRFFFSLTSVRFYFNSIAQWAMSRITQGIKMLAIKIQSDLVGNLQSEEWVIIKTQIKMYFYFNGVLWFDSKFTNSEKSFWFLMKTTCAGRHVLMFSGISQYTVQCTLVHLYSLQCALDSHRLHRSLSIEFERINQMYNWYVDVAFIFLFSFRFLVSKSASKLFYWCFLICHVLQSSFFVSTLWFGFGMYNGKCAPGSNEQRAAEGRYLLSAKYEIKRKQKSIITMIDSVHTKWNMFKLDRWWWNHTWHRGRSRFKSQQYFDKYAWIHKHSIRISHSYQFHPAHHRH